jgi:DNA-binding transcriptional LysR family regulator
MKRIHGKHLDLNLLQTLAVLIDERQVSRAAARLNLTQSAVSHALRRLREQFDDPLLIRRGQQMVPTARAEALIPALDRVLGEIDRMLGAESFDPGTATGTLRIATTDYGSAIILPHVVHALAEAAPRLSVSYSDLSASTFDELESGFLDLALSGQASQRNMRTQTLFTERFVIMARADHPCLQVPMSVDEYVRWPHVVVDLVHSRLYGIDAVLKGLSRKRTIGVRTPHFLAAPFLARHSDLLVPVPERLVDSYRATLGLVAIDPPPELDLGRFDYVQMWDERRSGEPVHRWLRALIHDAVGHLRDEPPLVS